MIPLLGFTPDVDPATPGVVTDCTNLIPTEKGMAGGPTPIAAVTGLAALASQARGASVLVNTSGTRRTVAGTQTKLYEISGATWADVSKVGNYTGSTENRWMFVQFGDAAIATNSTEKIQASTAGAFADIATAPQARIVVGAQNFVLAFDTFDATYGDRPDGWWCSEFQNHGVWTPSISTQATNGRLVGIPGAILAAAMLGGLCIAYKATGAYVGQYVGAPSVWDWTPVVGEFGCVGPEAVVDIGGAHFAVGPDNFWIYDGTRPIPVGNSQVRQWFYNNSSSTYRYRTIVRFDRQNNRVWVFFPDSTSETGTPNRALVYHLIRKEWGRADRSVECVLNFTTPGVSWDSLSTLGATWDALPSIPWDSQIWQVGGISLSYFDTAHTLQTLTGESDASTLVTGDFGGDSRSSTLNSVSLRFLTEPASAGVTGYTKSSSGKALVGNEMGTLDDGKFDIRQDDRWHRFAFSFDGAVEVNGIDVPLNGTGTR